MSELRIPNMARETNAEMNFSIFYKATNFNTENFIYIHLI